jgi:hypothetical protein
VRDAIRAGKRAQALTATCPASDLGALCRQDAACTTASDRAAGISANQRRDGKVQREGIGVSVRSSGLHRMELAYSTPVGSAQLACYSHQYQIRPHFVWVSRALSLLRYDHQWSISRKSVASAPPARLLGCLRLSGLCHAQYCDHAGRRAFCRQCLSHVASLQWIWTLLHNRPYAVPSTPCDVSCLHLMGGDSRVARGVCAVMNTMRTNPSGPTGSTTLTADSQDSLLDAQQFPLLATFLYDRFGAHCGRPVRRTVVSLGFGGAYFLVGLLITGAIGFGGTYVASPGVYLLIFSGVFTLDRLQWGKCNFIEQLNATRGVFIVDADEYMSSMSALLQRMTSWGPVVAIFLVLAAVVDAGIALSSTNVAEPAVAPLRSLGVLPIPSLPGAWFVSPHLGTKLLALDWLLAAAVFGVVALLYYSVQGVLGWAHIIQQWPVLPVPPAVRMRFAGFAVFYFRGLANTSLAVLAAVLFYAGRPEPPLVALVATFAIVGLLCGYVPLHRIRQLVARSQAQVAEAVSRRYVDAIYPVASGPTTPARPLAVGPMPTEATRLVTTDTFRELNALEELMHHVYEAGFTGFELNVLLPALLSQGIPLLGFLYPLVGRR